MSKAGNASGFALPHGAVYLLMTANIVIYGLCFHRSGSVTIPGPLLFQYGAMYQAALVRHEYWRLVANGFLHVDLVHLTTNMICLALWGGPLEKRVGAANFLIIYICSVIGGAVVGNLTHPTAYLAVGASGGTSGILGALFGLWILGKIGVPASFFVTNIGLNIALTLSVSRIDWRAHIGGFAAGLIACAILDLVAKANSVVLRCKFPEFIKVNLLLAACILGLIWWRGQPIALPASPEASLLLLEWALACLIVVKLVDFALALKHGLTVVALALCALNAGLVILASDILRSTLSSGCSAYRPFGIGLIDDLVHATCGGDPGLTINISAAAVFVLTMLLYSQDIYRGIADVGFIGNALSAERRRQSGI
jgi:membrane associated rhomboid family serine protease